MLAGMLEGGGAGVGVWAEAWETTDRRAGATRQPKTRGVSHVWDGDDEVRHRGGERTRNAGGVIRGVIRAPGLWQSEQTTFVKGDCSIPGGRRKFFATRRKFLLVKTAWKIIKASMKFVGSLLALALTASVALADIQQPPASDYGPTRKLGRGLSNVLFGPSEVIDSMCSINYQDGNSAAWGYGLVRGVGRSFARLGYGLYEMATFPFPTFAAPIVRLIAATFPGSTPGTRSFRLSSDSIPSTATFANTSATPGKNFPPRKKKALGRILPAPFSF